MMPNEDCIFTGEAGKNAFASTNALTTTFSDKKLLEESEPNQEEKPQDSEDAKEDSSSDDSEEEREKERKSRKKKKKKDKKKKSKKRNREKDFEAQVQEAMRKQEKEVLSASKNIDDRKRGYNSLYECKAPTEAEMEAYYRKRQREEDPMKHF